MNYKDIKHGDIINIKGIFGVSCIGIFHKFLNDVLILHCVTFKDLDKYVAFETDEKKYCFFSIDAIKSCELATDDEVKLLYTNIIKHYTEYVDTNWSKYFTDSTYYEVQDWFALKCAYNTDDEYPFFVYEFNDFAWNYLCNEIGYVEEEDDEKMVSVKTVLKWIEDMSEYTGIDSETLKESFLKKIDL